jgi:hypothetical protein
MCRAAKCINIRAAKKDCVQSAWVTTVPNLPAFYSLLFYSILSYEHSKDNNKALISKAVLLIFCKHAQKFQLNCALS